MSAPEHERKFLISDPSIIEGLPATKLVQGYLVITPKVELRVRTGPAGQVLTAKCPTDDVDKRDEEELIISDRLLAYALIEACDGRVVVKSRAIADIHHPADDVVDHWTIDSYAGDNRGLIVAEFEYPDDFDPARLLPLPSWVGREVTHLRRYYAASLSEYPYRDWTAAERLAP